MYYVYILHSQKDKGMYVGKTSDIQRRLREHNLGKVSSTRSRRPLELVKTYNFMSEEEALGWEKEMKKGFRREDLRRELGL